MKLQHNADTCGDVMVNALHGDGGVGYGVSLEVAHEALYATVNLQTQTKRPAQGLVQGERNLGFGKKTLCILRLSFFEPNIFKTHPFWCRWRLNTCSM